MRVSRVDEHRLATQRRLVAAARVHLSSGGILTPTLVDDICRQIGLHPHAFARVFPNEGLFLDAINDSLVDECAARLQSGVDGFVAVENADDAILQACIALADSWPLTRGGIIIRANRRLRALESGEEASQIAEAERRFLAELLDVFGELMNRLGRMFSWQPKLAVRVILDTYERSFETWLLEGKDELSFSESPYVRRTLPHLLTQMSMTDVRRR